MQSMKLVGVPEASTVVNSNQEKREAIDGSSVRQANKSTRIKVTPIQKYHKKYIDLLVDFEELQKVNQETNLENNKLKLKIKKYDEILGNEIDSEGV